MQTSDEGCYLPCRVSKVSHSSKVLFTCIWKVPLDYFNEDQIENEKYDKTPNWSPEQLEIIQSMGEDMSWKFNYDSVIEYVLS